MAKSMSGKGQAIAPMDELDAIVEANRTDNEIELVMRLRAAAEICEALDTTMLLGLARVCSVKTDKIAYLVQSVGRPTASPSTSV